MITPQDVNRFWLNEIGPKGWYAGGAEIDRACSDGFGAAQVALAAGAYRDWLSRPEGALAYLILADQLPRNIHRGTAAAYATDTLARSAAMMALERGHDRAISGIERQFFFLPFEHTESRQFQSLSVCYFRTRMPARMPQDGTDNLLHARAHREVIRRFGRFPFRNAALGRVSNAAEKAFLSEGGYRGVVEGLQG